MTTYTNLESIQADFAGAGLSFGRMSETMAGNLGKHFHERTTIHLISGDEFQRRVDEQQLEKNRNYFYQSQAFGDSVFYGSYRDVLLIKKTGGDGINRQDARHLVAGLAMISGDRGDLLGAYEEGWGWNQKKRFWSHEQTYNGDRPVLAQLGTDMLHASLIGEGFAVTDTRAITRQEAFDALPDLTRFSMQYLDKHSEGTAKWFRDQYWEWCYDHFTYDLAGLHADLWAVRQKMTAAARELANAENNPKVVKELLTLHADGKKPIAAEFQKRRGTFSSPYFQGLAEQSESAPAVVNAEWSLFGHAAGYIFRPGLYPEPSRYVGPHL